MKAIWQRKTHCVVRLPKRAGRGCLPTSSAFKWLSMLCSPRGTCNQSLWYNSLPASGDSAYQGIKFLSVAPHDTEIVKACWIWLHVFYWGCLNLKWMFPALAGGRTPSIRILDLDFMLILSKPLNFFVPQFSHL